MGILCYTEMQRRECMNKRIVQFFCLLLAMMLVVACSKETTPSQGKSSLANEKITVSAAASLQEALTEVRDNFAKKENIQGENISINFAGSGTLRQQIEQGAPVSVFISADMKNMDLLREKGFIKESRPLLENTLVLVYQKGKTAYTWDNLLTAQYISVGTPETVPAGKYAMNYFQKMGIWEEISPKVVYAKDVRSVLAQVSQGAVDAGIVYRTDALQGKDQVAIGAIAPNQGERVIYPAGTIKGKENNLSEAFYSYLFSEEARSILERYGFTVIK